MNESAQVLLAEKNPDCAWCGGECVVRYRNRHGEVFCSKSHRDSSNRALKRFLAADEDRQ